MGPILTSEQIHNIAADLLEMSRDDAFLRIGGMQVSDADRRRIISEYNELYDAHHIEAPRALPQENIKTIVSELVAMNYDEKARDYIAALKVTDEDRATITELYEKAVAALPQSFYLSQQQRDGIVSELLKIPYIEARNTLAAMEIAHGDRKLILDAYNRALAARNNSTPTPPRVPYTRYVNSPVPANSVPVKKKKFPLWAKTLIICVASVAAIVFLVNAIIIPAVESVYNQPSVLQSSQPSAEPTFDQPEVELPSNYSVTKHSTYGPVAPLEITTPYDGNYYYIMLRDHDTGESVIDFFMHSGDTHKFSVPLGDFDIYVACGETWYGEDYLFGPDGGYSKLDSIFSFTIEYDNQGSYYSGYELELETVYGGNLDSHEVEYDSLINGGE